MLLDPSSLDGPFCSAAGIKIDFVEALGQNDRCWRRLGLGQGLTWTPGGVHGPKRITKKCTRVADRAFAEVKVHPRQPGDFWPLSRFGLNVTYRLKTLLLMIAGIASVLAIAVFIQSIDWSYSLVASIECGSNRRINIYEDAFCDFATIPVYDVEINGQNSESKYATRLWYECGNQLDLNLFSHRIDDHGHLVAIMYDGDVVAIYDFNNSSNIDLPSTGDLMDIPENIRERLNLTETPGGE